MHSDNQLIRKVKRAGDRRAADELLKRYYREIYAFAYRQVSNQELAMDLTQDIFLAVLQGLISFDERKAKFRTWLYTVASNKITDYFRSKYHRQHVLEQELCEWEQSTDMFCFDEDVLRQIYGKELISRSMAIIVEYGNEWVRIFQMKLFLEETFEEIARQLHLSENTVKSRYYAMIKRLRKELADEDRV